MAYILIAEDETNIADVVKDILEGESHEVQVVHDGVEALAAVGERRPDLLILDVMMPKKSGFDVCSEIRSSDSTLPILFLTARCDEIDKVRGLNIGADDYLTKPFGSHELAARVSALLRRARSSSGTVVSGNEASNFVIAGHEVDTRRLLLKNIATGTSVHISPHAAVVLRVFADNPGIVLSRDELIDKAWGMKVGATTRTVDMMILKIRKLLGSNAHCIETIRPIGYRLKASC